MEEGRMTPTVEHGIGKAIEDLDKAVAELPNEETPVGHVSGQSYNARRFIEVARDRLCELLPPEHE
jgi:hypothetical protein